MNIHRMYQQGAFMYFKENVPMVSVIATSNIGSYYMGIKVEKSSYFFGFSILAKNRVLDRPTMVVNLSSWLPKKMARDRGNTTVADITSDFEGIKGFTYYSGIIPNYGVDDECY